MSVKEFIELISSFVALLTAIGALMVTFTQTKRTNFLLDYRMGNVEKKLDEHNNYAKRFEQIEKAIVGIEKDISFMKERMQ